MTNSGAYQITFELTADLELKIGHLGLCRFKTGKYIYTGSAMKNLSQRVSRHLSSNKKIRWHIDYLLSDKNCRILNAALFHSDNREECELNLKTIKELGASVPVKGFGSSDCRNCESHLIYLG